MLGLIFHKKVNKTNVTPPPSLTNISSYFDNQPNKKRLVAHWDKDQNSQLTCQWVFE